MNKQIPKIFTFNLFQKYSKIMDMNYLIKDSVYNNLNKNSSTHTIPVKNLQDSTLETRSAIIEQQLKNLTKDMKSFDLISFGISGIDSRIALCENDELKSKLNKFTMIGTPNNGSYLADLLQQERQLDQIQIEKIRMILGISEYSLQEINQKNILSLNEYLEDGEDKRYNTFNGNKIHSKMSDCLKEINGILMERNLYSDGLFSVEETQSHQHKGTFELDHFDLTYFTPKNTLTKFLFQLIMNWKQNQKTHDIEYYFNELKQSILRKIKKADIHQKRMKVSREGYFMNKMENPENLLFISQMVFLSHKFQDDDQLCMRFDMKEKFIEIKFKDNDQSEEKQVQGKIEIPFNEQLYFQLDRIKKAVVMKAKHVRLYKKSLSKKGNHWEKSAVQSFNVFRKVNKKNLSFKFHLFLQKEEIDKMIQNRAHLLKKLAQFSVNVTVNPSSRYPLPFKLIPEEKMIGISNHEKSLKKERREKKITQLLSISKKINRHLNPIHFYCPLYTCFQKFYSVQEMVLHVNSKHPEIGREKLSFDNQGNMIISEEHLNKMIMICKMIPDFMKQEVLQLGDKREQRVLAKKNQIYTENV